MRSRKDVAAIESRASLEETPFAQPAAWCRLCKRLLLKSSLRYCVVTQGAACYQMKSTVTALQQVLHAVLFALQLSQCLVDAFLREGINFQTFDDLVFAVFGSHREAEHDASGDAVFAI